MGTINMDNYWRTSVNELLHIYKGALISIVPWLDKAMIKWKDEDSYDDWENISQSLYSNIVCSSLLGDVIIESSIAKYNFLYNNYSSIDFLLVKSDKYFGKKFAFISFQSDLSPFDSVKLAELDEFDNVIGYLTIKDERLKFLYVKYNNGEKVIMDEVNVLI